MPKPVVRPSPDSPAFSTGASKLSVSGVVKFVFIFAVFNLNQLREAFAPFYAVLVIFALITLAIDLVQARFTLTRSTKISFALIGAYLACTLIAFLQSLALISLAGAVLGLTRFLFAFPVFLAAITYMRNTETMRAGLVGITVVVALLSLSLPYQIAFGQLSWLPSDYMRGGFVRYASLLGNVTAIGIAVGFYFGPALFMIRNTPLRIIITAMLLLSSVASLSKAALVNLALVPVIGLVQGFSRPFRVWGNWKASDVLKMVCVMLVSVVAAFTIPQVRDRMLVNLASAGLAAADRQDDVTIGQSIFERLIQHPLQIIASLERVYGEAGWITGAGFGMSSTALVPDDDSLSIMAHNQFMEFLAIGGLPFIFLFIGMLVNILLNLTQRAASSHSIDDPLGQNLWAVLITVFVSYITNLPFANGLVYQPLEASIFWLLAAVTCLPSPINAVPLKKRPVDGSA